MVYEPPQKLVKNCLRTRPDRIVVGECRGGEALDMLQAMNTGHDGSLTTAHANSPRDMLSRLEVTAGMELPVVAIREQIASAVNLIVQITRFARAGYAKGIPIFPSFRYLNIPHPVHISACSVRIKPAFNFSFNRYELPRMFRVTAWCNSLSRMAVAMTRSPNTSPQAVNP